MDTLRDLRALKHEAIRYEGSATQTNGHATFEISTQKWCDSRATEHGGKHIYNINI